MTLEEREVGVLRRLEERERNWNGFRITLAGIITIYFESVLFKKKNSTAVLTQFQSQQAVLYVTSENMSSGMETGNETTLTLCLLSDSGDGHLHSSQGQPPHGIVTYNQRLDQQPAQVLPCSVSFQANIRDIRAVF